MRIHDLIETTRIYQATTSKMDGFMKEKPQKETIPLCPRSPCVVVKLYTCTITVNHREAYGVYACNGILINHGSSQRGERFDIRNITGDLAHFNKSLQNSRTWATSIPAAIGATPTTMRLCSVRDYSSWERLEII